MNNEEPNGYSAYENSEVITDLFKKRAISDVLDVGAGMGFYGKLIKEISPTTNIEAVEIWKPTARYLRNLPCYDNVYECDIRNFNWLKSYSLVVFGDVLEHVELDEAIDIWHEAMASADIVMVSIPNGNYPQPAIYGNEAEAHKIENAEQDLIPKLDTPTRIYRYPITSTYIWEN